MCSARLSLMKIYVAAPLEAADQVREGQLLLVEAGHELALDWTQDMSLVEDFGSQPARSAHMATAMVDAVLAADALAVLATEFDGRGMFVELGAALARAEAGLLQGIAVIGRITKESVFYLHPRVQRFETLQEWLEELPEKR